MGGCLRAFDPLARLAGLALALAGAGCSARTIVAVDPYPCSEGGATGCAQQLLTDLIGYWRLDDAAGSATARDWSAWGNDGTLVGIDPSTAWVAGGPEGRALSVQGDGYVNVPDSASIDSITDQLTIAAWIFLQGTIADYATAISRQIGTGYDQHYHLSVNAQQQAILFITTPMAGQVVLGSPMTVPQQTWVHLAGTYDGSQARLYVNGTEVGNLPASGPFAAETNPVTLSGNGNGAARTVSEFVPGQLDEVMLYRRALSADEIARLESGALLPSGGTRSDGGPSGN
jgi:Concanavalin A-like lectin/glucanases superfamily